ncbi:MAG: HNH endonuclease [Methanomicrobiales archaeon]|nr:HNH endonuclease [Methanomicrobiales archaeon]
MTGKEKKKLPAATHSIREKVTYSHYDESIMPPAAVKTIGDQIFWQYAKLISRSAGLGNQRAFQMKKFIQLREGDIQWSSSIREWVKEHEHPDECIYCGSKENLTVEHILPLVRGGPDTVDNAIRVCTTCNSSKGAKRLYEWRGLGKKDTIPRIAEGKYLKLLYELHTTLGTLGIDRKELTQKLCPRCDESRLCEEAATVGQLTVYCLEGIFLKG